MDAAAEQDPVAAAAAPLAAEASTPPGRGALLREARLREASRLFRSPRMLAELPFAGLLAFVFHEGGLSSHRLAAMVSLLGLLFLFKVAEAVFSRGRKEPSDEAVMAVAGGLALVVEGCLLALTGGIHSPLILGLAVLPVVAVVTFGRGREANRSVAAVLGLAALIAALPESVVGPRLPSFHYSVGALLVLLAAILRIRAVVYRTSHGNLVAVEELERLRAENLRLAEEREKALRQVAAKVAHELKNPLSAIQGLVQLLEKTAPDEKTRERLGVIASESSRMGVLVRDYLSLNRPLEDLRPQPVDLGALVREVQAVLAAEAEQAGVTLRAAGEAHLSADPRRLKEALLNLVANAVQATPAGGEVHVEVAETPEHTHVHVSDSGRGMTADEVARVGTPFFTTRSQGTGLGVLLARAVAEQHGGGLQYRSEPGRGTTATFSLRR
jgi:signal transduction histidine kinase